MLNLGVGFTILFLTFSLFYIAINHAPKPKWQWGNKSKKEVAKKEIK